MSKTTSTTLPMSSAAPAGADAENEDISGLTDQQLRNDELINQVCEAWAHWSRTRRFYGPPPLAASVLGKLQKRTGTLRPQDMEVPCSASLLAMHMAIVAQPPEGIDAKVFRLHYEYRVKNVKAAAGVMGISRQHWYRLLREFRRRVYAASREILQTAENERAELERLRAERAPEAEGVSMLGRDELVERLTVNREVADLQGRGYVVAR